MNAFDTARIVLKVSVELGGPGDTGLSQSAQDTVEGVMSLDGDRYQLATRERDGEARRVGDALFLRGEAARWARFFADPERFSFSSLTAGTIPAGWVRVDAGAFPQLEGLGFVPDEPRSLLEALGAAGRVTALGEDNIEGQVAAHYEVRLEEREGAPASGKVEVWVDESDRAIRLAWQIERALTEGIRLRTANELTFVSFGDPLTVQPPGEFEILHPPTRR